MILEYIGIPFCLMGVSYLGAKYFGIGFILFAFFGGVFLAAYVRNNFDLRALWLTIPLCVISIIILMVAAILGAGRGAFDQKTPA